MRFSRWMIPPPPSQFTATPPMTYRDVPVAVPVASSPMEQQQPEEPKKRLKELEETLDEMLLVEPPPMLPMGALLVDPPPIAIPDHHTAQLRACVDCGGGRCCNAVACHWCHQDDVTFGIDESGMRVCSRHGISVTKVKCANCEWAWDQVGCNQYTKASSGGWQHVFCNTFCHGMWKRARERGANPSI